MKKYPHYVKNPEYRNPNNVNSVAYRLAYGLKLRKLLSTDICQMTGLSKSTMSLYLHGKSMPGKERLIIIADALRVDSAWLYGLTPLQAYNRYGDNDPYLDPDFEKIKNIYNSISKEGRTHLINTALLLFESDQYKRI